MGPEATGIHPMAAALAKGSHAATPAAMVPGSVGEKGSQASRVGQSSHNHPLPPFKRKATEKGGPGVPLLVSGSAPGEVTVLSRASDP